MDSLQNARQPPLTGLSAHTLTTSPTRRVANSSSDITTGLSTTRNNIPSPLQASVTASPTAPPAFPGSPRSPRADHTLYCSPPLSPDLQATHTAAAGILSTVTPPASPPLPADRARVPTRAKRVPSSAAQDELRSAVTRDALREEATRHTNAVQPSKPAVQRNVSAPVLTAGSPVASPVSSPTMASSSRSHAAASRAELDPNMPRNPSIDSTSSVTSSISTAHKLNGVAQEPAGPQDVAAAVTAAGSAEAAIRKLINEKNQAASHNTQLWRLVEKQRAMILGLNKDLEKSLKEKERYRRKLKESLAGSQSVRTLPATGQQVDDLASRETSQSPVAVDAKSSAMPASIRDMSIDSRKVSDTSDAGSLVQGRSDTPQDASAAPSSVLPATPQSASSANAVARDLERADIAGIQRMQPHEGRNAAPSGLQQTLTATPPMSPKTLDQAPLQDPSTVLRQGHHKNVSVSSATSPPHSATSFSSPKDKIGRKAPPAPLNLGQKNTQPVNNIVDPSDSEYEEDPDSARQEKMTRGRRKTREDDDREREMVARQEEEYRSQSKKSKSGKSQQPAEVVDLPQELAPTELPKVNAAQEQSDTVPMYQTPEDAAAPLHRQAIYAQSQGAPLPKSSAAPSLMSPGLPMSPRPGDRPMNSPMPRAPNKLLNSLPMSPKGGLPLSPRAPRQALPMPQQTVLAMQSPHLVRAEGYQAPNHLPPTSTLAGQLSPSPDNSPEAERPPTRSSDPIPMTPGEIYEGLVTEQYPDLLLPPNALPSVIVKTSSSRMRPSRQSYLAPKVEDNPVFVLAVHERSSNRQLWRVEKPFMALVQLDQLVKSVCVFRERVPDRTLFNGHAPAKMDSRRAALDRYFGSMLDAVVDEKSAKIICRFLSTDAIGASDGGDYFGSAEGSRADSPVTKLPLKREGYLTKRGKNFGGWKARYFQLDGSALKYYDDRGGAQLGSIKLVNAQIGKQSNNAQNPQEDEDNQFRHAFLILEPKKKDSSSLVRHVLCAESDEERDAWVESLLQYVESPAEEAEASRPSTAPKHEVLPPLSPRAAASFDHERPASRGQEVVEAGSSAPRGGNIPSVSYGDTKAGEAPVMGPAARKNGTPSPPYDGSFPAPDNSSHPIISGPSNLQVISNTSDWGMKPPPTPQGGKDKKRSIFAGFRGRSSSDLKDGISSPGMPAQDHLATGNGHGRAVFGVSLGEAVEFARPENVVTELPAVVYRCIEYLMAKNAIAEEGIFRLSGSNTVIKGLKDRFNMQGDINLLGDGEYYDIHAVASLLKLYLRELPSSILTRDLHLEFMRCLEMHGQDKVAALNVLVNKLPKANRALLEALSAFLMAIVDNSAVNKMNVRNGKRSYNHAVYL